MLMAELTVKTADGAQSYEMQDGKPLFVGRSAECDLYLPSPAVSRRHAVFLARNGHCGIKDLDSSNGTYLNGKRITKSMRLKEGDIVQIASFVIEFRMPSVQQYDEAEKTAVFAPVSKERVGGFTPVPTPVAPPVPQAPPRPHEPAAIMADETPPIEEPSDAEAYDEELVHGLNEAAVPMTAPAPTEPVSIAAADSSTPVDLEPESAPYSAPVPAEIHEPESAPVLPPLPPKMEMPHRAEISDDEVGDGAADADFLVEEEAQVDEAAKEMALAKAAAEAGLVGEFTPDVEEEGGNGGEGGASNGSVVIAGPGGLSSAVPVDMSEKYEPDPNAIPLSESFRQAIETRLFLYSFLSDMKREREEFVARRPRMADAVKSELARQDREVDKIPTPEQAENMIEKRRAKQKDLMDRIKAAKAQNEPPPAKPSREMREAEEMAISQWTFCAQSAREALPAVHREGYELMRSEPLSGMLEAVGVDPVALMGGAAYYLALEVLAEETKYHRSYVRTKLSVMASPEDKKPGKSRGVFGLFGRGAQEEEPEEAAEEEPGESYEELVSLEQQLANRIAWISQESASLEKALIAEFWRVYVAAALTFLPRHEEMPWPVRAFLRHGAIGFERWWMKEEVREHIADDCANDVVHHMKVSKNITNVLYADEYLAAVMNWECTPAMDENLEINERNSPNWKADKALRKLINARSQTVLMEELLGTLRERIDEQQAEADALDDDISKLLPGSKDFKRIKNELSQKRQSFKVEVTKLTNLSNKIRTETLSVLEEAVTETRERFDSGELPRPTPEFLIKRECDAVHKIGRLLANLKEKFLPLVLRDSFAVGTDACNDRTAILGEILEMERRDPSLFLENIVPSKKKANRVDLRISPTIVLVPSAGMLAFSWNPRQKPEDGRLGIPTCFIRRRIRERQITYLLADFRWDTSKAAAGMDVMTSETIVAAFMTVRWDWRKRSKEGREKGLIYTEQNDRTNWRRVYEAYSQTAYDAGKKLFNRNYDFYERIIGKYFDLPEDVTLLKK